MLKVMTIKVLKIASVFKHGNGGHFHSMRDIGDALNENDGIEVDFATIGNAKSPVFVEHPNYTHIEFNLSNLLSAFSNLKRYIEFKDYDVIHFYDSAVYSLTRILISKIKGKKVVLTKCGGPNIQNYLLSDSTIFFSHENYNYYKGRTKASWYMPNRVHFKDEPSSSHRECVNEIKILRISRIGAYYKESLIKTINFSKFLASRNVPHKLSIVGVIQDPEVFNELTSICSNSDSIEFLTKREFTANARKVIDNYDVVLATGRALMEASVRGKAVMCFSSEEEYPVFLTASNIEEIMKYNFSERVTFSTGGQNEKEVLQNFSDINRLRGLEAESVKLGQKYFNALTLSNDYLEIYKNLAEHQKNPSFSSLIKTVFRFFYYKIT